jgi:hypothetical protein
LAIISAPWSTAQSCIFVTWLHASRTPEKASAKLAETVDPVGGKVEASCKANSCDCKSAHPLHLFALLKRLQVNFGL